MPHEESSPTLVTGAAGFAGSHLVDRLSGRGPLIGWHRPGRQPLDSLPEISWHAVDLLDRDGVMRALGVARPSRVYHLAGAPRIDTSWHDVVPHLETNVLGTHHLLDAVRQTGMPCRVVIASSAMVYRGDTGRPVDEDVALQPSSPYGLSKLAQDQLALRAAAEGMDVVVARPFNHAGPRQAPNFVVASFARQIALIEAGRAEPEIRVGNLGVQRDLTDVRDVVSAYELLMERAPSGRPFNICSGRPVRVGDLLDELLRQSHVAVRVVVEAERLRPSDAAVFVGSAARIEQEIGWRPELTLTQTLGDTLEWWRQRVTFV